MELTPLSIPKRLYKYQSYNCHSIENLIKRQIYFPKPLELNDPFDCNVQFNFSLTTEEEFKSVCNKFDLPYSGNPADIDDLAKRIMEKKLQEFKKMGVACFSQSCTNKPENILLWSHYADGHKGFCLEFDTTFYPFQGLEINIQGVHYKKEYPSTRSALAIFGNIWIDPLITKSSEWAYEREWRLIVDKGASFCNYEPKALSGVYFGCLMPDTQISIIRSA